MAVVYIVSGKGKASILYNSLNEPSKLFSIGGILSFRFYNDNKSLGYQLYDIGNKCFVDLCSQEPKEGWTKYGKFYFSPKALEYGNKLLMSEQILAYDAIFIDTVGSMELHNEGWADGLNFLINHYHGVIYLCVRHEFTESIIKHFNIQKHVKLDV